MANSHTDIDSILERYWGYSTFRPLQREIIESVLEGYDTLGLLPTGGGKSITFQVPALALDGLTIVVTPLISLMKDQVDNLRERGIKASFLHSGLARRETRLILDKCRLGKLKMLYVSPEKLKSQNFISEMKLWDVSLIVVDEAHCISQWGYDFRPSYLRISDLRHMFPEAPVLALTASATVEVVEDIKDKLSFRDGSRQFSRSFSRDNISYLVRNVDSKKSMVLKILHSTSGSAIVYVRSRKRTKELADMIEADGISADFYHAGLATEDKNEKQNRWKAGQTRVMVATNAFGMGIDKADVRLVIHFDLPSSLEEYYQEAGRAGRDGLPSYAVIVTSARDKASLAKRISENFPPKSTILDIYDKVCVFMDIAVGGGYDEVFEFNEAAFCKRYGFTPAVVRSALSILSRSGYLEYCDDLHSRARVMVVARKEELYNLPVDQTTDAVFLALMRKYTGLFADYVYIDEGYIASQLPPITPEDVYQSLLTLQKMRILNYIPRRTTPYIYFPTSRELSRYLTIPTSVYEMRKEQMEHRIASMKAFTYDDSRCRASILLEYFGQSQETPCGKCDYCRMRKSFESGLKKKDALEQYILYRCSRGDGETPENLIASSPADRRLTLSAIRGMLDENVLRVDGEKIRTL